MRAGGWRESDINRWVADLIRWKPEDETYGAWKAGAAGAGGPARDRADDDSSEKFSRSRRATRPPTASEQLEALSGYPRPFPGRPPRHDLTTWTVTDDWPDPTPVTEAEIDVFERWFGDLFDELFDPGS